MSYNKCSLYTILSFKKWQIFDLPDFKIENYYSATLQILDNSRINIQKEEVLL